MPLRTYWKYSYCFHLTCHLKTLLKKELDLGVLFFFLTLVDLPKDFCSLASNSLEVLQSCLETVLIVVLAGFCLEKTVSEQLDGLFL